MSLSSLRRISREDLQGAPAWVDPLLTAQNEFQEEATASLGRDLLVGRFADYELVHGVESPPIKCPIGKIPRGISAVQCRGITVNSAGKSTGLMYTLGVARLDWRPLQSKPNEPPRVAVTAYFAPPAGDITVTRITDQVVADNTNTAISFTASEYMFGGLSWTIGTPTKVICASAGRVEICYHYLWDANATGIRQSYVYDGGAVNNAYSADDPGADIISLGRTDMISVAAGGFLEVIMYQNSGAPLSMLGATRAAFSARYVAPPVGTRGRVTLRFDGGQ